MFRTNKKRLFVMIAVIVALTLICSVAFAADEEAEAVSVTIEVKQDEYIVDGKPMNINEIDGLIHQVDMYKASFVLVDNYASAKAWDEIMSLMVSHGISVVEQ